VLLGETAFIAEAPALAYLVKSVTLGMRPQVPASLIEAGLLHYVAKDIKAPPENYEPICDVPIDQGAG
jgi:hypothetical protein